MSLSVQTVQAFARVGVGGIAVAAVQPLAWHDPVTGPASYDVPKGYVLLLMLATTTNFSGDLSLRVLVSERTYRFALGTSFEFRHPVLIREGQNVVLLVANEHSAAVQGADTFHAVHALLIENDTYDKLVGGYGESLPLY